MDLLTWTFGAKAPSPDRPVHKQKFLQQFCDTNSPKLLVDASDPSQWLSFNRIRREVRQLIAGLNVVGIKRGDAVWVNCFNDLRYSILYLGIIGAGAIFTGINPASTPAELSHHFWTTNPKLIIADPMLLHKLLSMAEVTRFERSKIFAFDASGFGSTCGIRSWHTLLKHGERDWLRPEDPEKTVATYSATSGTSGLPKWAMISHSYHVNQADFHCSKESVKMTRLFTLAPFHAFGSPIIPASIRQGVRTYIMHRYDETVFLECVHRHSISETYIAPPILLSLSMSPQAKAGNLKSLRSIWVGGASVKYAQQKPLYKLLHEKACIRSVWGMTEAGWITCVRDESKRDDDSVGQCLNGFELMLVDSTGTTINKDAVEGELLIRAPQPFLGYLRDQPSTRAAFTPCNFLLRSGDIGRRICDPTTGVASFYIVDRVKELIKVRGWQVSPTEVESELLQHPATRDVAVVGATERGRFEEFVRAYIVLEPGAFTPTAPEIRAWLRERLSSYKIPKEIRLVDSIPRNSTGKILRRVLRDEAQLQTTVAESGPDLDIDGSHKQEPVSSTTIAQHVKAEAMSS